jgi:predicted DNA binding CopG/RHH family protein
MKKSMIKDPYEKALLASVERGEWKPVPNMKEEIARYRACAQAQLRKNARVNIRLSSHDVEGIRRIAMEEGIPYQTLISSILHKYVAGTLGR